MTLKRLTGNLNATMAMGSMIIMIASVLTTGVASSLLISTNDSSSNQACAVADDVISNMVNGLIVVDATGHYTDNKLISIQYLMKTSPGSNPINMQNVTILITTDTDEIIYSYDDSPCFTITTFNGINDSVVSKGELLQLTIPMNNLTVGQDVIIKLIPNMGQILIMNFVVPDSLGNQFITF